MRHDAPSSMRRFDDRVAVVTGAGSGIGAATARRFAAEGAAVVCFDIDAGSIESLVAELADQGARASAVPGDVRSLDDQQAAVDAAMSTWGRLDVMVACAGVYAGGPLTDIPLERWAEVHATNLTGVLLSCRVAAPPMIATGGGSIITVASMAALTSWPESAEYSASKSGVLGITRSVAMELGPHGITANAVCPGNTDTPMLHQVASEVGGRLGMTGAEWMAMRAADTAVGRLAEPDEIAGVIAFLASDDARYMTGQSIEVDGGLILT